MNRYTAGLGFVSFWPSLFFGVAGDASGDDEWIDEWLESRWFPQRKGRVLAWLVRDSACWHIVVALIARIHVFSWPSFSGFEPVTFSS